MVTFTFHVDPGHAWLQVPAADLAAVGLTAADFSGYSYRHTHANGETFYLEEDCDATRFLVAYRVRHGRMPHLEELFCHRESPIRALPRLPAGDDEIGLPCSS